MPHNSTALCIHSYRLIKSKPSAVGLNIGCTYWQPIINGHKHTYNLVHKPMYHPLNTTRPCLLQMPLLSGTTSNSQDQLSLPFISLCRMDAAGLVNGGVNWDYLKFIGIHYQSLALELVFWVREPPQKKLATLALLLQNWFRDKPPNDRHKKADKRRLLKCWLAVLLLAFVAIATNRFFH